MDICACCSNTNSDCNIHGDSYNYNNIAMAMIRAEIDECPEIVKNAPYTQSEICGIWEYPFTREQAVFPNLPKNKFWPAVNRIDNVHGDRNLVCACQ